jgi:hypothetical protein
MLRHPEVRGSLTKEVHFFDAHFDKGVDWYSGMFRGAFPKSRIIRGEASPGYIFHPASVQRIAETLDDPRLIVVLRDPVQRAFSHFNHERRLGYEPCATFEEALALEEERVADEFEQLSDGRLATSFAVGHFSYVRRGLYVDQIKRAAEVIGRERLLILISEEMFDDPVSTLSVALEFAGASPHTINEVGANDMAFESRPMNAQTKETLEKQFAGPNAELAEFLGRDLPW